MRHQFLRINLRTLCNMHNVVCDFDFMPKAIKKLSREVCRVLLHVHRVITARAFAHYFNKKSQKP